MNKLILLIISLIYLPYSYAAGYNGSVNILAPIMGAFQAGDYEVQRSRQEGEMLQTQYQNYMMAVQLQQYNDARYAEWYLSPFWTYYYQARNKGVKPLDFVVGIINKVYSDQDLKNMSAEKQGRVYQLLSERIKQLAYKLQSEGDSKSANIIFNTLGK